MTAKGCPIVYIRFLDHLSSPPSISIPYPCEVFGVLWKQDKLAYYVVSWIAGGSLEDDNSEVYCILKSTVVELMYLKKGGKRGIKTKRTN